MTVSKVNAPRLALALVLVLFLVPHSAAQPCPHPPPGLTGLLQPGVVVLLGEIHGTNESPGFLRDAACRALGVGRSVTVALEIPASEASLVDAYLKSSDSLTVRNAHAMAYDSDREMVLLFGGADERQVLGDLWAWDGATWRSLAASGPPPRTFASMAYDDARHTLLLFGGNRVLFGTPSDTLTFLDDMWSWDGKAWRQIQTQTPPARAEASMVYDSHRRRIVLFGGYRYERGEKIRLRDTWEWDGLQWTRVSSDGPPPMNGTAMAFDARRNRTVLFGGSGASGDTWEWDGEQWERIESAETEGRFNPIMAYDTKQEAIIRFGGWTGSDRVGDTWLYDGARWREVETEGPAGRNHASMTYDARRQVVVLFGGHDGDQVFGDTWEWNGDAWSLRAGGPPRLRVDNGH